MRAGVLRAMVAAQEAGCDVVVATRLGDGAQELIEADGGGGRREGGAWSRRPS